MREYSGLIKILILVLAMAILTGCSGAGSASEGVDHSGSPRDNTPKVLKAKADGNEVYGDGNITIDASNKTKGYIMVKTPKGDVISKVSAPDGDEYTYYLGSGDYQTIPLTSGDGNYSIQILDGIGGNNYVMSYCTSIYVEIKDEFKPYLYPNVYSDFTSKSKVVAKAKELAADTWTDLEVVENVYNFVIKNVEYDYDLAESVTTGYVPNPDETLEKGTGICFDYASLMVSMLRSQRIPTKLVVGYSGETYHAWISVYVDDIGWVDNVIEFDGKNWSLMDPTLASNNSADEVKKYVGDGENYTVKYTY